MKRLSGVRATTRIRNTSSPISRVTSRGKRRRRDLEGGMGTKNTNTQTKKKANRFKLNHQTLKEFTVYLIFHKSFTLDRCGQCYLFILIPASTFF